MAATYIPPVAVGSVAAEVAIRAAADAALQDELDALEATGATDDELAALVAAHAADTTAVHGIADTALLVLDDDARLTDDRDPTAHTHTSAAVTDFAEAVMDAVNALLGEGSNVTLTYNDALDTLEIAAAADGSGLDAEAVRDAIGIALIGAGLVSVAVNDGADTITIATTATANDTNANLRDRTTHTGAQAIATITGLQAALDALQPLNANLTAIGALAPSNDDLLQRKAGAWTNRTPTQVKTDLALQNVTNTSDANKPVSTAQQTALDLKTNETTRSASGKGFVNHGAVTGTARPTGWASVEWVGSVEPTNAVNGDTWINTA